MGKIYVVGLGPGNFDNMTIKADKALKESEIIVGYNVYVDLIRDRYPDKDYVMTGMTKEVERCEKAIELAGEGKTVSVICSGDSGIYGMAGLIYELRGRKKEPEIEVVPGITSATSGAALLGAPLTHDFSVISLSDRLTEWSLIETRLRKAAEGDFSIVIYNPSSKGRPDYLKRACEILMDTIPEDRVCGIARNIGREEESREILTLGELKEKSIDMFCTVFIGNSSSKIIEDNFVTPRGYRNV